MVVAVCKIWQLSLRSLSCRAGRVKKSFDAGKCIVIYAALHRLAYYWKAKGRVRVQTHWHCFHSPVPPQEMKNLKIHILGQNATIACLSLFINYFLNQVEMPLWVKAKNIVGPSCLLAPKQNLKSYRMAEKYCMINRTIISCHIFAATFLVDVGACQAYAFVSVQERQIAFPAILLLFTSFHALNWIRC